jgi:putative hydrolase of the HAD superfamily
MEYPEVRALVFDLGGVIVAHDNDVMHRRIAGRCAEGYGPEDVARLTDDALWNTGAPISELHATLTVEAAYQGDWPTFVDDWCCHLVLNPSMLAYVEALAARHRVMIFSNTNKEHWDSQVRVSGGRLARIKAHLSHELGATKPDLASYKLVAERAGLPPESLLFFDDVPANVAGARRAGWQAEVFTREAALRALLSERGFEAAH